MKMKCPEGGKESPGYDVARERKWRHLDACGYETVICARVPGCECAEHGVKSVRPAWAEPGSRYTQPFKRYAIEALLAARSVRDACKLLGIDWDAAARIRERAVQRGLALREVEEIAYLGLDEKSFGRGHHYGTVLSDLEKRSVVEVVEHRETASAKAALETLPEATRRGVKAVAMDMWKTFLQATREVLPGACVAHDKFHVMRYLSEAVDQVRRKEHRELLAQGDQSLTGSKYLWLMNPANFSEEQEVEFKQLLDNQIKVGGAWNLKELFGSIGEKEMRGNAFARGIARRSAPGWSR